VLAHTISNVLASVVAETGRRVLEIHCSLPAGKVRSSQVGRPRDKLRDGIGELRENNLGQLSGSDGVVGRLVNRQSLFPASRKVSGDTAGKVLGLFRVLLAVRLEKSLPLGLDLGSALGNGSVSLFGRVGDDEGLLGVKAKLGLDGLGVVRLKSVAVDAVRALELGTIADSGPKN
jgi:hypothetical protein